MRNTNKPHALTELIRQRRSHQRTSPVPLVGAIARWAAIGLAIGWCASAHAADPSASIVGIGNVTGGCGEWRAASQNSIVDTAYSSWLAGYVSSFNTIAVLGGNADFIRGYDGRSLFPWAKRWCGEHPLDQVSNAAAALVVELAQRAAAQK